MRNKVKKFARSAAVLSVIGALALFGALALPNADTADAQDDGTTGFIVPPTTAPNTPTVETRNKAIAVTIAAPASHTVAEVGSPDYTGFDLRYKKTDASDWINFNGAATVNTRNLSGAALITGLENGVAYHVQVRVTRGDAAGPWSNTSANVTPKPTQPGKVRNLKAAQTDYVKAAERPNSNEDYAYIPVEWEPPEDDGGSPITGYKLDTFKGGTGDSISANPTKIGRASYNSRKPTLAKVRLNGNDAAHNQWLRFKVAARNTAGIGPAETVEIRLDADLEPYTDKTPFRGNISSSSRGSNVPLRLTVEVKNLAASLRVGTRIVLFLEDDFQVPDSIPASSVYFVANSPRTVATGSGTTVYATVPPVIETNDYFDDHKNDFSIQVRIPDMCAGDFDVCIGPNGPVMGQDLTMVILPSAGIRNPIESGGGGESVAFDVLGFNDPVPERIERLTNAKGNEVGAVRHTLPDARAAFLPTYSRISLSDVEGERGYKLTVSANGFNNGVTVVAYVNQYKAAKFAIAQYWNTLDCDSKVAAMQNWYGIGKEFCFHYILDSDKMTYNAPAGSKSNSQKVIDWHLCTIGAARAGVRVGSVIVGDDNKATITFEVNAPTFQPGHNNLICLLDGEYRRGRSGHGHSASFNLKPSIKALPADPRIGERVTILARDFPTAGAPFKELKLGGEVFTGHVSSTSIGSNGSATVTFDLPPHINGVALEGTMRIDAKWGNKSDDTKVTILPTALNVSRTSPRPNETLTLTCNGLGPGSANAIRAENITLDGVPLKVRSDSLYSDQEVPVSRSGRCVFAAALWPASDSDPNPALTPGPHTIKVTDNAGYTASVAITIPEPTVKVTPAVAGPRDVLTVSGANWPVENRDGAQLEVVDITVTDGEQPDRKYSRYADGSGRWFIEHQVSGAVTIPSTSRIEARYSDELVRLGSYRVPASIVSVEPGECQPGDSVTLSAYRLPVHSRISRVEIGGRDVMPAGTPSTNGDGAVTVENVIVPGLDAGTYSVLIEVEETVAVGSMEILSERPSGTETLVDEALAPLGDNLAAVFYFDGVSKTWLFYDARPEFAEMNTLEKLVAGETYWVLVATDVNDVALNGRSRSFTCSAAGNCWNLMVW